MDSGSELVVRAAGVSLPRAAQVEASLAQVGPAKDRLAAAVLRNLGRPQLEEALRRALALRGTAEQLRGTLDASRRSVSEDEIGAALSTLVLAFPNPSRDVDLAGYGAQLADDVRSLAPSVFALQTGCTRLRRTARFLPAISEVLGAIQAAEAMAARADFQARDLPVWIERAEQLLGGAGA